LRTRVRVLFRAMASLSPSKTWCCRGICGLRCVRGRSSPSLPTAQLVHVAARTLFPLGGVLKPFPQAFLQRVRPKAGENQMNQSTVNRGHRRAVGVPWGIVPSLVAVGLAASMLVTTAEAAGITLNVVSASDGTPISEYKYIVNQDNTGTTAQRSPDPGTGCSP